MGRLLDRVDRLLAGPTRTCKTCGQTRPVYDFQSRADLHESLNYERVHCNLAHKVNVCNDCYFYETTVTASQADVLRRLVDVPLLDVPEDVPHDGPEALLGYDVETDAPLTLSPDLRTRHLYVVGTTGRGKTTLLTTLFLQDARHGHGAAFLDPHGDAAGYLPGAVPPERLDDVTYFCPTDPASPSFNLLALPFPPHKLTDDILSAFKMFFASSWGPRLEHLLRNSLATLLLDRTQEPHSLADLKTLCLSEAYRDRLASRLPHEGLRTFWRDEFPTMGRDAVNPLLNKLSAFLAPLSPLERLFSATENALDVPALMNGGKLLIASLPKGEPAPRRARLWARFSRPRFSSRRLHARPFRRPSGGPSTSTPTSFRPTSSHRSRPSCPRARKYRLCLTLANQQFVELPSSLQHAVFGAHTLVAFGVISNDATRLASEMRSRRPRMRPDPVAALRRRHAGYVDRARTFLSFLRPTPGGSFVFPYRLPNANDPREPVLQKLIDRDVLAPPRLRDSLLEYATHYLADPRASSPWLRSHLILPTPEYEAWPTAEDFTNLPTHTALVRIERADNVHHIRTTPPAPSSAETRTAVLNRPACARRRERSLPSSIDAHNTAASGCSGHSPAPTSRRRFPLPLLGRAVTLNARVPTGSRPPFPNAAPRERFSTPSLSLSVRRDEIRKTGTILP